MASIDDLETPAVLVDLDVVERNVSRMAGWAREAGVSLRPHAKTHKIVRIGRMQLDAGASGISFAKVSEAEAFASEGFQDVFLAYPIVGRGKPARVAALSGRIKVSCGVDSVEGARALAAPFATGGRRLDVLIKVDVGFARVGVPPEGVAALARSILTTPGLRFAGLFTHAGHGYGGETPDAVAAVADREGRAIAEIAADLEGAGIPVETRSVGSTPTARRAMAVPGINECRPGNYVYHDATQVSLGTCGIEDCALTVLATVVSVPAQGRAVVDAGSKTLSSDLLRPHAGGYGFILGTGSRLSRLSEEHGVIQVEDGDAFRVGQCVRILPNHACVVSNLHDRVVAVRGEAVEGRLDVLARGRVD